MVSGRAGLSQPREREWGCQGREGSLTGVRKLPGKEYKRVALASVAQLVATSSNNQKIVGFDPWSWPIGSLVQEYMGGNQLMFLSLPSSLSKSNGKKMSSVRI